MAELKRKKPSHGDLANHKQQVSIEINMTELAKPQKFNLYRCQLKNKSALSLHQICKGKSAMDPSNNTTEHMDIVDQIKENPFNQITNTELAISQKFNLSRCRLMKQSAVSPDYISKGKSAMEPSINITEDMDTDDQEIEIFQEEIIMEILSRLPVRSLYRFKCVSKFWMALISDPYFKKKHLNRAKNDEKFLASKVCPDKGDVYFYCSSLSSVPLGKDEQKLDYPSNVSPFCRLLCSCDGLILVSIFEGNDHEHLILWNPSTRESKLLPHPGRYMLCDWLFGLAYDTSSDDYKILAINLHFFRMDLQGIQSKILALKSGSWRSCKYPTHIRRLSGNFGAGMDSLAFLHGAFHWLGYKGYPRTPVIIKFDISTEGFGEMPLPSDFPCGIGFDCGVSVLGGTLCSYAASFEVENEPSKLWVWEMKEYGVKESWTSLLTIRDTYESRVARPQYRYADGEVLIHCKSLISADFIYRRTRGPFELSPSKVIVHYGITYTESLISPKLLSI